VPRITRILLLTATLLAGVGPANGQTVTGRTIPSPVYGVTLDDVSSLSAEIKALSQLIKPPTVRVVFDKGTSASYYKSPIQQLRGTAYILGELIDSYYMKQFTSINSVQSWTNSYVTTLGSLVDVWEIGNEVNGSWLGTSPSVMSKVEAMYDIVAAKGGKTALTFFYEGEPNESHNCIDKSGGGNDMFTWINQQFLSSPTAETEKIRLGINYALISWYPDQCPGESPSWPSVYTKLASIFPNAKVAFGELGTADPQNGSSYEKNEISTYYPMAKTQAGLPPGYIGGYFWWYFAEEMVPWPGSLGLTLNSGLAAGP
jgi:hypothetical protein